jgi:hypothetical protein
MGITAKFKIKSSKVGEALEAKKSAVSAISRKTAFDVQGDYQSNAQKDTGAMVGSAYVVTSDSSTYSAAQSDAKAANPDVKLLSEVPAPKDETTSLVAVGASYAWFVERKFPAMTPAVERHRSAYFNALRRILYAK